MEFLKKVFGKEHSAKTSQSESLDNEIHNKIDLVFKLIKEQFNADEIEIEYEYDGEKFTLNKQGAHSEGGVDFWRHGAEFKRLFHEEVQHIIGDEYIIEISENSVLTIKPARIE